jgi:hypothetical protein
LYSYPKTNLKVLFSLIFIVHFKVHQPEISASNTIISTSWLFLIFFICRRECKYRCVCFMSGVGAPGVSFEVMLLLSYGVSECFGCGVLRVPFLLLLSWQNSSCWCYFLSVAQHVCCCFGLDSCCLCWELSWGSFGLEEA